PRRSPAAATALPTPVAAPPRLLPAAALARLPPPVAPPRRPPAAAPLRGPLAVTLSLRPRAGQLRLRSPRRRRPAFGEMACSATFPCHPERSEGSGRGRMEPLASAMPCGPSAHGAPPCRAEAPHAQPAREHSRAAARPRLLRSPAPRLP